MRKEEIWQMALASGLCDADLSSDEQVCTDYGDATEAVEKFAAMIVAACVNKIERLSGETYAVVLCEHKEAADWLRSNA